MKRRNLKQEQQQFWNRVDRPSPHACWPAQHTPSSANALVSYQGRTWLAHRLAVWLTRPQDRALLRKGRPVLHQCDNNRCCNPLHLVVGTQRQNVREMIQRGRWRFNLRP